MSLWKKSRGGKFIQSNLRNMNRFCTIKLLRHQPLVALVATVITVPFPSVVTKVYLHRNFADISPGIISWDVWKGQSWTVACLLIQQSLSICQYCLIFEPGHSHSLSLPCPEAGDVYHLPFHHRHIWSLTHKKWWNTCKESWVCLTEGMC